MNSAIGFPNTYPLDSDLSGGWRYPAFEQLGPGRSLPRSGESGLCVGPVTPHFKTITGKWNLTVCHTGSSLTSSEVPDDKRCDSLTSLRVLELPTFQTKFHFSWRFEKLEFHCVHCVFIRSVCLFVCLFVCKNPLVALATLTKLSFFPLKNKERLTPFLRKWRHQEGFFSEIKRMVHVLAEISGHY